MDGQVLTWAGVTTILGIVLPPFMALVKRFGWEKRKQDLVILGLLIAAGAVAGFLVGDIDPRACSGIELAECVLKIAAYVGMTLVQAVAWYKSYWEDSAVENKIVILGRLSGREQDSREIDILLPLLSRWPPAVRNRWGLSFGARELPKSRAQLA